MDRRQKNCGGVSVLIPAAGESSRMRGKDKLLLETGGVSLLRRAVMAGLASAGSEVIVILRRNHRRRRMSLAGLDHIVAYSDSAVNEMSASLKAGLTRVSQRSCGVLILLPDMPSIETRHINALISGFDGQRITRARTAGGRPGHPVIFPRQHFSWIRTAHGDRGAALRFANVETAICWVDFPGNLASRDIDTPEDWEAWCRQSRN